MKLRRGKAAHAFPLLVVDADAEPRLKALLRHCSSASLGSTEPCRVLGGGGAEPGIGASPQCAGRRAAVLGVCGDTRSLPEPTTGESRPEGSSKSARLRFFAIGGSASLARARGAGASPAGVHT